MAGFFYLRLAEQYLAVKPRSVRDLWNTRRKDLTVRSIMPQSFIYREIDQVQPLKRLMVNYLCVHTSTKQYFLHTPEPAYWADRILKMKRSVAQAPEVSRPAGPVSRTKKQDLSDMLMTLRKYNFLTDAELAEKKSCSKRSNFKPADRHDPCSTFRTWRRAGRRRTRRS